MYIRNLIIFFLFLLMACSSLVTIFAEKTTLEKEGSSIDFLSVTGVVDRIENDELAIILVEELELEFVVKKSDFTEKLAQYDWVDLIIVRNEIKELTINQEKTQERGKEIKELMEELKQDMD
ncbi:DUF3006 domain-containing protein [Paucisalibacillus globulus]|uniref:DUF3006 domain-containing protein n=1 Tax=Paucisalibacillus globulus TaxID=351095 RepID=UPI000BB6A82B|nr:DUF3006 domain-containing protein [Paucisalibacillus globulus]